MRLSRYFLPIHKDDPQEASLISHKLMLRAGMIKQSASGIYDWLPLGLAVMSKIKAIVREEMNQSGAVEVLLPSVQPAHLWKRSGRLGLDDDLNNEMLKMKDRSGQDLVFAPTAEEAIVDLVIGNIQSYKSLPKVFYQLGWKFRDEIRPRYGVMRSREFLMKDAYSFHINQDCALNTYELMLQTYLRIYKRLGVTVIPVSADTGAIGGNYSHEFHILADTGESTIYYEAALLDILVNNEEVNLKILQNFYAAEEEKHKDIEIMKKITNSKGIEVGHIFYLGDKYSKAMKMTIQNKEGKLINPEMGCYGIGISRLVGALIEVHHDQRGIVWPAEIAPFKIGLLNLKVGDDKCDQYSDKVCSILEGLGVEYLYDDSNDSAGIKFARADLIGIPKQLIIGLSAINSQQVEIKDRKTDQKEFINIDQLESYFKSMYVSSGYRD